ncbi:MAG TPA: LamG-like jellyroll fold domain-containing protein, partial [Blastocatellia bacterium]|nr:LamG-like jellyroll fold domain-containing protein [Blastocatellia bacterium]
AGTMRFGIANGGTEQMLETAALPANQWTHVAVTLSGTTGRLYVNGVLAASSENITIHPSDFRPMQNYIGKSQFPDPLFSGRLDEFLIYNYGLSSEQIAALAADRNPPSFVSDPISRPDAVSGQLYNGSIEDAATDDDPGEVLTYSKVTGPSWLQVAPSGRIFGTPAAGDAGQNRITVRVTDQALVSTDAVLVINIPVAPPSAPSGLAAKAGYGQVTLTWTGAARATSYNLKRSTTSGGPYATIAGSIIGTSYTDTALVNDTAAYYYVVSAVNSLAESADSGEAGATPSSSTVVIVANPGFETPVTTSFIYNPSSNNEWMFSGSPGSGSGVATNNSGFTSANPNAPEGRQVAFLQSSAIISQTLGGFVKGQTYRLTFLAAQRTRAAQIGQTWEVRIDGVTVASFAPPQSSNTYSEYTATFTAGAATHTLAVVGTNINGGDNTIFLDNVRIAQVP